jgi:hypothetical protein
MASSTGITTAKLNRVGRDIAADDGEDETAEAAIAVETNRQEAVPDSPLRKDPRRSSSPTAHRWAGSIRPAKRGSSDGQATAIWPTRPTRM